MLSGELLVVARDIHHHMLHVLGLKQANVPLGSAPTPILQSGVPRAEFDGRSVPCPVPRELQKARNRYAKLYTALAGNIV